jgi:hypothetical protein
VEIVLSRALDASGVFEIAVDADGTLRTCQASLSENDCAGLMVFWTGEEPTETDSGAPLPKGGLAGLLVPGRWQTLSLAIAQDGRQVVLHQWTALDYRGVEINGPGCGECALATVRADVL